MKYRLVGACAVAFCCAAPAFAQGLTRVELLGLQQQLRDDGCGVTHITGRMDAMTRSAVKKCESKYSGATDAKSMLGAMHIGFENGNAAPTMAMARSGEGGSMSAGGMSGSMNDSMGRHMRNGYMRNGHMRNGMMRTMKDSDAGHMMRRGRKPGSSTMSHDSSTIKDDMMSKKPDMMSKHHTMPKHDTMPNTH